ncbi:NUDIX domain-containing protein, partial [Porphyromonas endodontalis]|uniref:NUDIX domain-containing protein n=1 Tax=Porphyromonas endodontalis TaxID=28124 RepID=UPI0036F27990
TFSLEHRLSHQILHITIYTAELESDTLGSTKYQWVRESELGDYALPTPLVRFLEHLH